ncbi:hypothetical protein [Rubritalea tangerina]|uniref:Uncharacterized protein n=1 Tax=Rubritalea tangerina TaxID=430798 RepID=A0ABW4ZD05_9BACT
MIRLVLAGMVVLGLTGCGGIRYAQHDARAVRSGGELSPVHLEVGGAKKVVTHRQGVALVGGYREGVWLEDESVAEVRYGDGSDRFAPEVYLVGKKEGETWAWYGNRLGSAPRGDQVAGRFRVEVR